MQNKNMSNEEYKAVLLNLISKIDDIETILFLILLIEGTLEERGGD
jgi:hypothetical protein